MSARLDPPKELEYRAVTPQPCLATSDLTRLQPKLLSTQWRACGSRAVRVTTTNTHQLYVTEGVTHAACKTNIHDEEQHAGYPHAHAPSLRQIVTRAPSINPNTLRRWLGQGTTTQKADLTRSRRQFVLQLIQTGRRRASSGQWSKCRWRTKVARKRDGNQPHYQRVGRRRVP
jgi:hypothetical protein